jgi:hypothetical protein
MDFSELHDYDGFRESRKEEPHVDEATPVADDDRGRDGKFVGQSPKVTVEPE